MSTFIDELARQRQAIKRDILDTLRQAAQYATSHFISDDTARRLREKKKELSALESRLSRARSTGRPPRVVLRVNRPTRVVEEELDEEDWGEIEEELEKERTETRMVWVTKRKRSSQDAADDAMSEDAGHEDGFYNWSATPKLDKKLDTDSDYKRMRSGELEREFAEANTLLEKDFDNNFIDDRDVPESEMPYSCVMGDEAWNKFIKLSRVYMLDRSPSPVERDPLDDLEERCEAVEEKRGRKRRREVTPSSSTSAASSSSESDAMSYCQPDEYDEEYAIGDDNPKMRPNVTMDMVDDDLSSVSAYDENLIEEGEQTGGYVDDAEITEVVGPLDDDEEMEDVDGKMEESVDAA